MNKAIRILIVEDETMIAMSLTNELKRSGYNVYNVLSTGEDAVTCVKQEPPDLILMDIRLAGEIDGIEAIEKIRAFSNTPVIFMTASADIKIAERAKKFDPIGYFIKPFDSDELKALIGIQFQ